VTTKRMAAIMAERERIERRKAAAAAKRRASEALRAKPPTGDTTEG
jgi:hypothetical protein